IGVRAVANAKPDGQTLFYAVGTNVVINPWVQKGMIDTLATLAPICQTTSYQYVLAINPKVAANTAAELVALAQKDPEKLTFSFFRVGGNNHLAGALFAEAAGVQLTHVPYKGTGPALADVISGQITMNFSSLPPAPARANRGTDPNEFPPPAPRGRPDKGGKSAGVGRDRREAHQVAARRADA